MKFLIDFDHFTVEDKNSLIKLESFD
jgi:hypothetical protein